MPMQDFLSRELIKKYLGCRVWCSLLFPRRRFVRATGFMKLFLIIVVALSTFLSAPPTADSCYATFRDRMVRIQALLDDGTITPKVAAAMRKEAFKAYQKCLDSIPPSDPN